MKTLLFGLNMPLINDDAKYNERKNIEWMTNLPEAVRSLPISRLSIPGSHNSFTYSLTKSGKAGPDQPECIRKISALFPSIASRILIRWGICQHKLVTYQLENGVRYFDIRLEALNGLENVENETEMEIESQRSHQILHCLLGSQIQPILLEIKSFLSAHSKEVVILDLQHLYQFEPEDHTFLMRTLLDMFQDKICPWQLDMDDITLDGMSQAGHQVIIIYPALYRSQALESKIIDGLGDLEFFNYPPSQMFWPRNLCPTPWPNTTSGPKMETFLDKGLSERDPKFLFVSQGIFTPNLGTILCHPFSTLETACAKRCNKMVLQWLLKQNNHLHQPNIVIADFLFDDDCSWNIVDQIISLNNLHT